MLKTFLSACLICLALSASLSKTESAELVELPHKPSNLQFSDYVGAGVTAEQLSFFKQAVTDASDLYRDDAQRNLIHIKTQMNAKFGNSNQNYQVFIQQDPYTFSNYVVYTMGGNNFAGVKNINSTTNPNWSYLFVKTIIPSTATYYYIAHVDSGSGITSQLSTYIDKTIRTYEPKKACDCSATSSIQNRLDNYDNQQWNVICDDSNDVSAYVYAVDQQWIYTSPEECYYLIFVI